MRITSVVIASLLSSIGLATNESGDQKFATYKASQLSKYSALRLDDAAYGALTAAPRNYSAAVLLTALDPKFGCGACHTFQPEWDLLTKSWIKGDKAGASKVVFGTLDFNDGRGTFHSLMLQTAPILLVFPPTQGPYAKTNGQPKRLDFGQGVLTAESVHNWISKALPHGPTPAVSRPVNYVKIVSIIVAVLGVVTVLAVFGPYLLPVIQSRNLWAAISLITILLFTSGHMYNHIRSVPYVAGDNKGGVSYFAGGFQNQLGLETQIVAAMYGVLAFATISLALRVPRIADEKSQQIAVLVWSGVIFVMYSFLLSIFRFKNGGYPFWLPPF